MFKMAAASSKVPLVSSVFRSGLFQDKAAIVTGGGTGIGRAIAQELLHLGTILPSSCACTGTVSDEISTKSKMLRIIRVRLGLGPVQLHFKLLSCQ